LLATKATMLSPCKAKQEAAVEERPVGHGGRPPGPFAKAYKPIQARLATAIGEKLWDELDWHGRSRPTPLANGHVAGQKLHQSHPAWRKGRFTFCGLCGAYASERHPVSLLAQCPGHPTNTGREGALRRIRKGWPPQYPTKEWGVAACATLHVSP
jgi:hypothetical protein